MMQFVAFATVVASALQCSSGVRPMRGARHPWTVASAASPAVELRQLLPMQPPIDLGAKATLMFRLEGGAPRDPVWIPGEKTLVLTAAGRQLCLQEGASAASTLPGAPTDVMVQAAFGDSSLATFSASGGLSCVLVGEEKVFIPSQEPLIGGPGLAPIRCAASIRAARLLAVSSGGELLRFGTDEAPRPLLRGLDGVNALAVSANEQDLYMCTAGGIQRFELDLEATECRAAASAVNAELPAGGATALALDKVGRLYACTSEGVLVADEYGESILLLSTPAPATGVCFGGASLSELYVTAGECLWRVPTNTRGVRPPTAKFLRDMDKQAAAGDFRHDGW